MKEDETESNGVEQTGNGAEWTRKDLERTRV